MPLPGGLCTTSSGGPIHALGRVRSPRPRGQRLHQYRRTTCARRDRRHRPRRAPKLASGRGPVPIHVVRDRGGLRLHLREVRLDLSGFADHLFPFRHRFTASHHSVVAAQTPDRSHSGIGRCVIRIFLDSKLEVTHRRIERFRRQGLPLEPSFQIRLSASGLTGRTAARRLWSAGRSVIASARATPRATSLWSARTLDISCSKVSLHRCV